MTVENLQLMLTEMKLAHVVLGNVGVGLGAMEVRRECRLLLPVSLTLQITRNLSFDTNNRLPAIDVRGKLPLIDVSRRARLNRSFTCVQVTITQEDYVCIMRTLSGNLTEGMPPPSSVAASLASTDVKTLSRQPSRSPSVLGESSSAQAVSPHTTSSLLSPAPVVSKQTLSTIATKTAFNFDVEGLVLRMYTGSSRLVGAHAAV
jgi:hypothetical protein